MTLEEALKTVYEIADRHERQLRLLETAARIDKIRRQDQERGQREVV